MFKDECVYLLNDLLLQRLNKVLVCGIQGTCKHEVLPDLKPDTEPKPEAETNLK